MSEHVKDEFAEAAAPENQASPEPQPTEPDIEFIQDIVALNNLMESETSEEIVNIKGKFIKFYIRPLTPGEQAILQDTMYADLAAAAVKKYGAKANQAKIQKYILDNISDTKRQAEGANERILGTIELGVVGVEGIPEKAFKGLKKNYLRNWTPSALNQLHNAIQELSTQPTAVDNFSDMGEQSEE